MVMQRVTSVIVGAGLMGRWHAYYLRQTGRTIVGVADPDLNAARALARRFGARQFHDSTADLPGVGSVWHICTPTPSHGELIEQALRAGAHALVEKPLCAGSEQTAGLLDDAAERNLLICPVHQFLWQRGTLRVFRFLETLGDICHLRMSILTAGAIGQDDAATAAILADMLPHPLALLVRLAGPDAEVKLAPVHGSPSDMLISGAAGNISVDICLSTRGRPTRCEAELVGTRNSARLNFFHGYALFDNGALSRRHKIVQPLTGALHTQAAAVSNLLYRAATREPAYPGLRELIRRFYRAVEGGGANPGPVTETLRVSVLRGDLLRGSGDR